MNQATKNKPIAVLISDIHFTPATLDLASKALQQAIDRAYELEVPLIVAGDTLDSKAIIRGECANRLIEIFSDSPLAQEDMIILVGNHDMINEKSEEEHSLRFLEKYVKIVDTANFLALSGVKIYFIPYQHDVEKCRQILSKIPSGSTVIMHQGLTKSKAGHYLQDKSALEPEDVKNYRVISGHYHMRQDIKCGRPQRGAVGLFSYIGNPYTLTFAEANDPEKGFQVLYSDGLLEFVPTKLRKHWIVEINASDIHNLTKFESGHKLWVKIKGTSAESAVIKKAELAKIIGYSDFKLDLVPIEAEAIETKEVHKKSSGALLDQLIENLKETPVHTTYLKALWRELLK